MCKHDELILQELASIKELAAETRKVSEAQIGALRNQITTHTEFTKDKLESIAIKHDKEFEYVKGELRAIKTETKSTNSRVTHVEHNQETCLINTLGPEFKMYKDKMRPIYLIATSWKMIVGIAVVFGVVLTIGQAAMGWLYKLFEINIPG